MDVSHELHRAFSQVPINKLLGLELVERSAGAAVVSMGVIPEFTQETGIMHGGLVSVIADTAAVYLFLPDLPEGQSITSIEFKINFLNPVFAGKGPVLSKSKLIKKGSKVGVAESSVLQGESLIAKGTFTYLFLPK